MNELIVGAAAGATIFSGHGILVCGVGSVALGILNCWLTIRRLNSSDRN